ncbi:MAG: UDP-N-acetylmuramoyl-tripeptide--D-alanyl-D-alanine ligase [Bacteroidota bacterium]
MSHDIEFLYARFLLSNGVSIDTRTIEKDNLFVAVSGPNFNANRFAAEALEKGASYAIVDDKDYHDGEKTILVPNGLKALQELATYHRQRFKRPVIGITGSNGKTTTKELLRAVLQQKFIVHSTKGNYNNHIGVPLTLLHIHPQVEVAVIEMGANRVGDIAELCSYAKPTHGLITNIGKAHTETFGGVEGIIRGKSELYDYLLKSCGKVFINYLDPVLSNMAKRFKEAEIYPQDDLKLLKHHPHLEFQINESQHETQLIGKYNFSNIAAAISVGRHFEVGDDKIADAIKNYKASNARSQVIRKNGTTILLDAYNANPDSMKVALEGLSEYEGNRVAILGDMNELENEDDEHKRLLDFARSLGIEQVFTVGQKIGKVANPAYHYATKEALQKTLEHVDFRGNTVLLKASRSIQLEKMLDFIAS